MDEPLRVEKWKLRPGKEESVIKKLKITLPWFYLAWDGTEEALKSFQV